MKKITFFLVLVIVFLTHLKSNAQIINEPANWPNANWTISGSYNMVNGFASDPRTTENFSWDDDLAGSASLSDDIAAESPTINLTTAIPSEQQLQVTVDYVYRRVGDVLTLEWWDQSTGTWQVWQQFQNNSNNIDYKSCIGMQTFVSQPLIIATFSTAQLLSFKYRIRYNDNGFDWGMCFASPTLISLETPPCLSVSAITINPDDITESQAVIDWTDNNGVPPANGWEIEYGPTGFAQGTGTVVPAVLHPFTLSGLDPETSYDVYIRALCSDIEQSDWVGPVGFTTPISTTGQGCGGQFVDSGGANGQYDNNEDVTTVLCPEDAGDVVTINFLSFDTESCCDNLSIYDGPDVSAPLLGTFVGTDLPPTFTSTHETGCLTFVFHSDGSIVRDGWVANIICSPPPTCFAPINIVVSNITENSADITWTDNNTPPPANGWEVEVVISGVTPTGVGTPTTVNTFLATGLDPTSLYDVYVRAVCDDSGTDDPSFWIASTFATLIAPPECGGIFVDSGGPLDNYSNNEDVTTVICPEVAGEVVTVNFLSFNTEACCDNLTIYNGNTATGTPIGVYVGADLPPIITSTDATGCLTFVFHSDGSITGEGWVANVLCGPPPTCFIPTNLDATSTTHESATLSWTETTLPTAATAWNVEIILDDGSEPTGVGVPVTENPYIATNLEQDTAYCYYVQADCGGGDTSFWAGPFCFETEITPPTCGGFFVDDGGANDNYSNNENSITIICPTDSGDVVSIEFTSFNILDGDTLTIYNGDTATGTPLGIYNGTDFPPTFISSHTSGCMTFVFESGVFGNTDGWIGNVICAPPPSCFPVSNIVVDSVDATTAQISWLDNNSVPPVGGWDVEYGASGFVQGTGIVDSNTSNPHTIIGLAPSTDHDAYVRANCAVGSLDSSLWFGPVSFRTDDAPPPNDTCITAIPLLVTTFCEPTLGNNILATSSTDIEGEVIPTCGGDPLVNVSASDVWFTFTVPDTGKVFVETTPVNGGMVDTVLAAYTGTCGDLVELKCQDDASPNLPDPSDFRFSSINLEDLTPGETIYVRAWSYPDYTSAGNFIPEVPGAFNICVYGQSHGFSPAPLGLDDVNIDNDVQLSFYPNPVTDILTVNSDKEISEIVLYSLLGQEIMKKSFNNLTHLTLDIEKLSAGTYFAKVLIVGKTKTFKIIKK